MENNKITSAIIIGALIIAGAILIKQPNENKIKNNKENTNRVTQINKTLGLNEKDMTECIISTNAIQKVESDIASATALGIQGTPHSFIVYKGVVVDSIRGALPEELIQEKINTILNSTEIQTPEELKDLNFKNIDPNIDHIKGNSSLDLVIVEYSDTECPFCQRFHKSMQNIIAKNPNVSWVYRHYPLTTIHPNAKNEALASECASIISGEKENFWKYIDEIFK